MPTTGFAAWQEGWKAFQENKPRKDNPYKFGTFEHFNWNAGWDAAFLDKDGQSYE